MLTRHPRACALAGGSAVLLAMATLYIPIVLHVQEFVAGVLPPSAPHGVYAALVDGLAAIAVIAPAALVAVFLDAHLRRPAPPRETRCRRCGYVLRGLTEPRCPECGERI